MAAFMVVSFSRYVQVMFRGEAQRMNTILGREAGRKNHAAFNTSFR